MEAVRAIVAVDAEADGEGNDEGDAADDDSGDRNYKGPSADEVRPFRIVALPVGHYWRQEITAIVTRFRRFNTTFTRAEYNAGEFKRLN